MGKKKRVILLLLSLAAATAGFLADGDPRDPDSPSLLAEFAFMTLVCTGFFTVALLAAGYVRDRIFSRRR